MGMRPQGNEQEARRNKHVRSAPAKIAVKALGEDVLDGILDKSPNPLLLILDCVQDPTTWEPFCGRRTARAWMP